jgi:hypothetical protein
MRKRSAAEILFRLNQELGNIRQLAIKPGLPSAVDIPRLDLPDAVWAARKVKGTPYAAEVERLANEVLAHRFPVLGFLIETGPDINWRRDYIHGKSSGTEYFRFVKYLDFNAVGDHKIVWELNRHQHLVLLAQAAEITGSQKYLDELVKQVESWMQQNPYERGINWASALEVAFRTLSWIWIFHMVGKRFTQEFRRRFLTGIFQHGCFLENNLSVYFSPNTHLLGEAVALHAVGALFPQFPRAQRWKSSGREWVRKQMEFQVRPDGSHFEQSSYYQVYATDMFLFHLLLDADAPLAYKDRLGKMADYIDALLGPERSMPIFGDDDGGRFFFPYGDKAAFGRGTLATASLLLERDYGFEETDVYEQAVWWLSSRLLKNVSRPRNSRGSNWNYPDAGVSIGVRDETTIVFKWGGFGHGGAGHSHADVLSMTARLAGEELLIDAGTYSYMESREEREWFRSVAAHNTIRVDGVNQAQPEDPFRWRAKPQVVSVDPWTGIANYGGFSHKRNINLSRAGLIIVTDEIEGAGGGDHFVEQFWHTGVEARMLTPACFALGKKARIHLQPGTSRDWEVGGEFGWRSRAYGVKEAATVVRASKRGPLPMKMVAVIDLHGTFDEWPL